MKPAKFARQYDSQSLDNIKKSRRQALQKIIRDAYTQVLGLNDDHPQALWRFALANSELLSGEPVYKEFRATLGSPTLRETILSLMQSSKDDAALLRHLETLATISKKLPMTNSDFASNRRDSDRTARLLVEFWIDETLQQNALRRNFCFFSDLAMAKMVYFLTHGKQHWVPDARLNMNRERERIRKLYTSLGLIAAKPRAIKDVEFKAGKIHWIPFKSALIVQR